MKVMHIEAGRHLYGGARQVLYLVEGLTARGHTNMVVCPIDSEIAQRLAHTGMMVFPTQMSGDLDFAQIGRLRQLIEEQQPDVIHLHSRRGADWYGGIAARRFPEIPVVLSRRVDNPESKLLLGYKYRLFDRVIAISNAIRNVLFEAGVPESKLRVVHSSVKTSTWEHRWDRLAFLKTFFPDLSSNNSDAPIIGMVAQLIPRKGHRFMIEALPTVLAKYPNAKLIFFGRGREQNNLTQLATELGVRDSVVFAGFRKDINHWLGCLDVFVHPPLAEGLGVAVLQAAAASLPIVASRVGGIVEIIENNISGYLVDPGEVEQISDGILRLLDNPTDAAEMGVAAHAKVVEQFSVDAMVEGNLKIYRELLDET